MERDGSAFGDRETIMRAKALTDRASYAVFGAPIATGNLGVSALAISTLAGIASRDPDVQVTLFDFARGSSEASLRWPGGTLHYVRRGAYRSRRFHRPENLRTMYLAAAVAPAFNPNVRVIDRADAVLDISGGDSFTDMYGPRRFVLVTMPKRIALRRGRPLHLLPQTYGPFRSRTSHELAAQIVTGAESAWARDEQSFEVLRELLGDRFDPSRHRCGVDVAFLLPRADPGVELPGLSGWIRSDHQVVGLNVSGLLSNDSELAQERFGLAVDHWGGMQQLVRRFLDRTDARILLVPHVNGQPHDSDDSANERLLEALSDQGDRVAVLPPGLDAMETKWAIGACDWFAGARMHATIAALSQAVPVAGIAYSDKMAGVFASCGVEDQIVDARRGSTVEFVDALWERWERRDGTRDELERRLPEVKQRAAAQLDQIMAISGSTS